MFTPEDYAWCAGFFDGEGTTLNYRGNYKATTGEAKLYVRAQVGQKDRRVLDKFHRIVGVGNIHQQTMNGQPFFSWTAASHQDVVLVQNILWPHLGEAKKLQMSTAIARTTLVSGQVVKREDI